MKSDEDSSSEDDDSDEESPPTPKKGRGSEKNKSAEFVKSDKDSSSEAARLMAQYKKDLARYKEGLIPSMKYAAIKSMLSYAF